MSEQFIDLHGFNRFTRTSSVVTWDRDEACASDQSEVLVDGTASTGSTVSAPIANHPLAQVVGSFANDPFWAAVELEIRKNRRQPWWRFWASR